MRKPKIEQGQQSVPSITPPVVSQGPLTLQELFEFIQRRGAERVQLIRTTGQGRLDASIVPVSTGNIMIVLEVNPTKGVVV